MNAKDKRVEMSVFFFLMTKQGLGSGVISYTSLPIQSRPDHRLESIQLIG